MPASQMCVLQAFVSCVYPSHGDPQFLCPTTVRLRVVCPVPQGSEHVPHLLHSENLQSTGAASQTGLQPRPCMAGPTSAAPPPERFVYRERANFTRLVLGGGGGGGCIEAKFCKKICVGKLSPRSTKCTPLHRFGIESVLVESV